ncbi:MAG: hypothetical protein FJZ86_17905 [Chloroflexi bacterium]|nr:hypothetical protein [Chloroflexota bacterium]
MEPVQFWTLVISLIGAAAWIPHLISLVITLTKRPLITITPSSHADVGFTELGPIINIKVAITSDNGDSLIDLIELDVRHESGSKYKFRWHEVSEMKGQMLVSGVSSESIS